MASFLSLPKGVPLSIDELLHPFFRVVSIVEIVPQEGPAVLNGRGVDGVGVTAGGFRGRHLNSERARAAHSRPGKPPKPTIHHPADVGKSKYSISHVAHVKVEMLDDDLLLRWIELGTGT